MRVEKPWHRVPREAVAAPGSLEVPKARLDRVQSSLGQWEVSLPLAGNGMSWVLNSLPTQTIMGFCDFLALCHFIRFLDSKFSKEEFFPSF